MQDQHSISVAAEIRQSIPSQITGSVHGLNILLTGEDIEKADGTVRIRKKGELTIYGQVDNIHMKSKLIEAIRERSNGRQVKDSTTVKRAEDPLKRRIFF